MKERSLLALLQVQHWKSQQPPSAPAGSRAAGRELAELWAGNGSLRRSAPPTLALILLL